MMPIAMRSATRDMKAAQGFFRSARSIVGFAPDRVTTDGHNSYPRAIRSTLGRDVRHRTSVYLNNRLEQDHRGIKGRIRCMRGFKEYAAADRFTESTTNSATSSAADLVTTNTLQQPATPSLSPARPHPNGHHANRIVSRSGRAMRCKRRET
jgi:transposase-like protein